MDYSLVDSLDIPVYDSIGNIISNKKFPNEPIMDWIPTMIEIEEDWYYNLSKNIFLSDIKHAYLFTNPNSELKESGLQKRFKITFK